MANLPTQVDLRIAMSGTYEVSNIKKATLALSPTGDIQVVEGKDKLAEQLMRLIVNDGTQFGNFLNAPVSIARQLTALAIVYLREFKQRQIDETRKNEEDLVGFYIYRRVAGDFRFTRVTNTPVIWYFLDSDMQNGISYEYQITKLYNTGFESGPVDTFTASPTQFSAEKDVLVNNISCVFTGNMQIGIYVTYNRLFLGSELLNKILAITPSQDITEPRRFILDIEVEDLSGNKSSVSSMGSSAI
jgi:hypothetical protein